MQGKYGVDPYRAVHGQSRRRVRKRAEEEGRAPTREEGGGPEGEESPLLDLDGKCPFPAVE